MVNLAELAGEDHVGNGGQRVAGAKQEHLVVGWVAAVAIEEGFL